MTGEQIYSRFRVLFSSFVPELKSFKRLDPNTIELKTKAGPIYIFSYYSEKKFMFKTATFKEA